MGDHFWKRSVLNQSYALYKPPIAYLGNPNSVITIFSWELSEKNTYMGMTADEYVVPTKQIVSPSDLHAFLHSNSYKLINDFVEDLSQSVEDIPISPDIKTSQVSQSIANTRILMIVECGHYAGNSRQYRPISNRESSGRNEKSIWERGIPFSLRCVRKGTGVLTPR